MSVSLESRLSEDPSAGSGVNSQVDRLSKDS
jgi:hypothetical protein